MEEIDLRICREGDILISSQGVILEYISPTPWQGHTYLDHVVRFVEDQYGEKYNKVHSSYCTRTNDGFAFAFSRSKTDHDIVKIYHKRNILIEKTLKK